MVIRPNDFSLSGVGCAHEGAVSTRLGLPAVPVSAETVALAQALALMEGSGVRIHFGQLSSAGAVSMIAAAKARGQMVSADVAAHQLHLTEDAVAGFDANAHVLPPLRSQADMQALRVGLAEGVIDAICSDHQPHELDAKLDAFPATEPGISALETLLSLSLALVAEGVLPVSTAVARLTSFPARILGLPAGTLAVGAAADLCIFDPQLTWTLASGSWRSQGHNTPFWGQTLRGRVVETLRGGVSVFRLDPARS
jgi:dihydroorotase